MPSHCEWCRKATDRLIHESKDEISGLAYGFCSDHCCREFILCKPKVNKFAPPGGTYNPDEFDDENLEMNILCRPIPRKKD